jgi:hypothetical protein
MPRARRVRDEVTFDPALEQIRESLRAFGRDPDAPARPWPAWDKAQAKAVKAWDRMTVAERLAWFSDHLSVVRRRYNEGASLPRRESDRRDLYAVAVAAQRLARKWSKLVRYVAPPSAPPRPTEPRPSGPVRPVAAIEAPPADSQPPKRRAPRKRLRAGLAFVELPDGRRIFPIRDDDDR